MSVNPFHSKYFEDVKCRRHGEAACPSCLSYALSDANAAVASARAQALEEAALAVCRHLVSEGFDEEDALAARDVIRALKVKP